MLRRWDTHPAMNEPADRDLVTRYLEAREESAFRALYRRHAAAIWRTSLRIAGNASDAEDIVQETWIRAAERLDRFAWGSALSTWLIGIAINVARERRRDAGREKPLLQLVRTASRPDLSVDLERAIAALAPGYREVLVLHDVEGHTHEEIGALLGVDAGTSKSQLSRARRALRAALSSQGAPDESRTG
jgi:RNA polymerase sigma-70 factor (ECF subfamily)